MKSNEKPSNEKCASCANGIEKGVHLCETCSLHEEWVVKLLAVDAERDALKAEAAGTVKPLLRAQIQELETENKRLRAELSRQDAALARHDRHRFLSRMKVDAIGLHAACVDADNERLRAELSRQDAALLGKLRELDLMQVAPALCRQNTEQETQLTALRDAALTLCREHVAGADDPETEDYAACDALRDAELAVRELIPDVPPARHLVEVAS